MFESCRTWSDQVREAHPRARIVESVKDGVEDIRGTARTRSNGVEPKEVDFKAA